MTTAFLARYSKAQDAPILIITEDIPRDWKSIHPDDDTHTGPTLDMFPEALANGVLRGDWFVTQNDELYKATLQARSGHQVTIEVDKIAKEITNVVTEPDNEWSSDDIELLMQFVHATLD